MKKYHVVYFYLATGMEDMSSERDYGIINASSADEAKEKVIDDEIPTGDDGARQWLKSCLTAKEIC